MTLETTSGPDLGRGVQRTSLLYGQGIRDPKEQLLGLYQSYGQKEHVPSNMCRNIRQEAPGNNKSITLARPNGCYSITTSQSTQKMYIVLSVQNYFSFTYSSRDGKKKFV